MPRHRGGPTAPPTTGRASRCRSPSRRATASRGAAAHRWRRSDPCAGGTDRSMRTAAAVGGTGMRGPLRRLQVAAGQVVLVQDEVRPASAVELARPHEVVDAEYLANAWPAIAFSTMWIGLHQSLHSRKSPSSGKDMRGNGMLHLTAEQRITAPASEHAWRLPGHYRRGVAMSPGSRRSSWTMRRCSSNVDCNSGSHGVGGARRSSTGSVTPASFAAASASR